MSNIRHLPQIPLLTVGLLVCTLFFASISTVSAAQTTPSSVTIARGQFCAHVIAPLSAAEKTAGQNSRVLKSECFASKESLETAVSKGWTNVAGQTFSAESLLKPNGTLSQQFLLDLYDNSGYSGSMQRWYTDNSGCSGGPFGIGNLNDFNFNDKATSGIPGCGKTITLYEDINGGGVNRSVFSAPVNDFGGMSDRGSSWGTN